ncbi:hypothetical protein D3C84_1065430 [compost metagenome]
MLEPVDHQAGIEGDDDEQPHTHGKRGVDVLAGGTVLHRLTQQDDHGDQGIEPEAWGLQRRTQAIQLAPDQ